MQLALDIGNTRIKWGLREQNGWRETGSLPTTDWAQIAGILGNHRPLTRVLATNVAGPAVETGIGRCCESMNAPLEWVRPSPEAAGVTNHYDIPQQLGADRWVALIGARSLTAQPAVVVNAGTATTADALTSAGEFLGGLILPGLTLMATALAQGTADLPLTSGHYADFPKNTADAIATGRLLATVGAIEHLATTLQSRHSEPVICILGGGCGAELAPHIQRPILSVEHLVLEGLARLMRS